MADLKGDFWDGGLDFGALEGGFSSSEDEDEVSSSLREMAESRLKEGERVDARSARRALRVLEGERVEKRLASSEMVSSSVVEKWDRSLMLRMMWSSSFSSRRSCRARLL